MDLWQKSLRIDYQPVDHISAIAKNYQLDGREILIAFTRS
ncbi:MAG: protein rep [Spirirestis rafaelensis WJT71-NPBG6]|nr:protein rep [Spirirestis rafaelensis WJT71-NPBG6]